MRLIFMRHGSTAWNEAKRLQGMSDISLSATGRAWVSDLALSRDLAAAIDVCYSSPLCRALATAEAVCRGLEVEILTEPRLREMAFGAWEGETLVSVGYRLRYLRARLEREGLYFAAPGGESPHAVMLRLADFLRDLWARYGSAGVILCVAHKGVIRALYAWASGWDMVSESSDKLDMERLQSFIFDGRNLAVERLNIAFAAGREKI